MSKTKHIHVFVEEDISIYKKHHTEGTTFNHL